MKRLKCGCGGLQPKYYCSEWNNSTPHYVGDPKCYRTECILEEEPIKLPEEYLNKSLWLVDGQIITDYTLKYQRMYSQHNDGRWSRLKIKNSFNSLDG